VGGRFGMSKFDYSAAAELYPSRSRGPRKQPVGYKRFEQAAEALRFAIEEMPSESLVGAYLEVDEGRFDADEMRALYESPDYPLPRNPPAETGQSARASLVARPPGLGVVNAGGAGKKTR
jgi:hypothetical protein